MSPHPVFDDKSSLSGDKTFDGIEKGGTIDTQVALFDSEAQLRVFNTVSRFLPEGNEHEVFWWKVTGRHVARMMHEAGYSEQRQGELLLFYRFVVVPRLGPKPTSGDPSFRSRVAPGVGDGGPIGYSWRWGTGINSKPLIRHYVEPIGNLTGTAADPLNEIANKEMLWELGKILPTTSLDLVWKFAAHIRPTLTDEATREVAGSSMLVGLEWSPGESGTVDVMAGLMTRAPGQVSELMSTIFPNAMRDAYGADVSLDCLNTVRDFIETDPHGSYLTVLGTTAIDCCKPETSRFKVYVTTSNTSFDHIAAVMTLGGRKPESAKSLAQLRGLWYGLKGLSPDFPTSTEAPSLLIANGDGTAALSNLNTSGVTFYFDIHPKYTVSHVKIQVDVSKHASSDLVGIEAVTGFLQRRGQERDARAYMNLLRGMVPEEELRTRRGLQAFFAFAIKNGEIDITSYFLPQVYRRFDYIQAEMNPSTRTGQRRSRFGSLD
ncbi:VrtC [Penicillium malachiteum]|uniref:VrtC n=1 Tax=Penicillium malachiteum TaxID=1324776 RepID=A0AAD6HUI6_9EURO|nr:VrtC [Penicillium malachiteum]